MLDYSSNPFETIAAGTALDRRRHWAVFRIFNYYRVVLIGLLLGISYFDSNTRFLGVQNNPLFQAIALVYIGQIVIALGASLLRRPSLATQAFLQTLVDIVVLSTMAYLSGGLSSNLIPLLVVAIGASSVILPLYLALVAATLACVGLFALWLVPLYPEAGVIISDPQTWPQLIDVLLVDHVRDLVKIAVLAACIYAATLIINYIASRTRHTEELAHQRSLELLDMANLNQAIVKHIQSGIVVVDTLGRIKVLNQTARDQLDLQDALHDTMLNDVSESLAQRLATWISTGLNNAKPFRAATHLPDVSPLFSYLADSNQASTQQVHRNSTDILILLEDSGQVEQRVQRIKLAALGRLTASIAHEIRNPLAAIDHAAQLLRESVTGSSSDKRLGNIIHENATRASQIISNILDLSRRERAKPEDIMLRTWLEEFCQEFLRSYSGLAPHIEIRISPKDLNIRFDAVHLHQVTWNLLTNACKHGIREGQESARIKVVAAFDQEQQRAYLDIIDSGPGIDSDGQKRIFEPFFTTKAKGTGLGLYISREICEANRSQLQYIDRTPELGGCFRITFAQAVARKKAPPVSANDTLFKKTS